MNKSVKSILGLSALVCIGAAVLLAEDAPGAAVPAPETKTTKVEAAVEPKFDSRIDTWVEGIVVKLDAAGAKMSVGGHKMPYASVHAAMINDIATKTANLEPALRPAKEQEIQLSWQDKLSKASAEEPAKDAEINLRVPAQGQVLVKGEAELPNLDLFRHEKSMAAIPAAPVAGVVGAPLPPVRNDQELAKTDISKSTEEKQIVALGAFGDLKVGEPVYVGYASGIVNNDLFAVVKRTSLQPPQPGKN